jgi:D-3-phosphoglycerate dehydrogenase
MRALVRATLTDDAAARLVEEFEWELLDGGGDGIPPMGLAADTIEALVVETQQVDAGVLARLPGLRLIACLRGTPVNVDVEAATRRGIPVLHAPGRNADSVADFTIGLLISVTRHIAPAHHRVVARQLTERRGVTARPRKDVIWVPSDPAAPRPYQLYKGPELRSLVLGLIGFGAIGRRVCERARALGVRVLVSDPFVPAGVVREHDAEHLPLRELLAVSDVVSLHARRAESWILGEDELLTLPRGSYVINTSRADQLDYDALVRLLRSGHLAGAALDVYPDEPLDEDSPLLNLPNVTLTPHIAGASTNIVEHQSRLLLSGLRSLRGAPGAPSTLVSNPEVLEPR